MGIQRRYKHLNRFREIANTLARHGFGLILDGLGLTHLVRPGERFRSRPEEEPLSGGERLRLVLEALGTTAIKLGQVLSTRPDLLPPDMISELQKLQDRVPAFPFEQVRQQVEAELDQPLSRVFPEFQEEPLAAASIGQVHRARLVTGEDVVVKVQRPGIEEVIRTDLEILRDLARLAQRRTQWGKIYSFVEMADEFARTLQEEMDYQSEARNGDQFRENFHNWSEVYIPRVYWDYTTARILTMEYVEGSKLEANSDKYNPDRVAENLARAVYQMVLIDGFFHGDLHPGNIAILPDNVIAFMDFGMVGRLSRTDKKQFADLILSMTRGDSARIVRIFIQMGMVDSRGDLEELRREVDRLRDQYYRVPLSELSLGKTVNEILRLAFKYHLRIPSEFTLLAKTIITLEGTVQDLYPGMSLMKIAEPFKRQMLYERLSPEVWGRDLLDYVEEQGRLLLGLPRQMAEIVDTVLSDRLTLKLEHLNVSRTLDRLDRIANKLTFAMVLLAFSIIMAGLIIASALGAGTSSFFWRLPILHIGFGIAALMILWLIFAILRSGRF